MTLRLKQIIRRANDDIILAAILGLCATAAMAVSIDTAAARAKQHPQEQFQKLVRGLGVGCQADLARCAWQFDPRLTDDEDTPLDVIAGSDAFNPWHSLSLFPAPGESWKAPRQD